MTYQSRLQDKFMDQLIEAILSLKNKEEGYRFFEDLCTVAELKAMSQRLAVAKMLKQDLTYTEIAASTGASTATISRVKKFLFFGADGYRLVLKLLAANSG